jgi:hypothetical protein
MKGNIMKDYVIIIIFGIIILAVVLGIFENALMNKSSFSSFNGLKDRLNKIINWFIGW